MSTENIVNFSGYQCKLELNYYDREQTKLSIQLVSAVSDSTKDLWKGEPITRATYNDPTVMLSSSEIMIKNCRENKGMVESLLVAGLVEGETLTDKEKSFDMVILKKSPLLIQIENEFRNSMGVSPLVLNDENMKESEPDISNNSGRKIRIK